LSLGNPGDIKPVGSGISELRISYGPGYRIYLVAAEQDRWILLNGGSKRTQVRDIESARRLAQEWKDQHG
jgi:putative addiction module killer protein